jgi:hypothetical protein
VSEISVTASVPVTAATKSAVVIEVVPIRKKTLSLLLDPAVVSCHST